MLVEVVWAFAFGHVATYVMSAEAPDPELGGPNEEVTLTSGDLSSMAGTCPAQRCGSQRQLERASQVDVLD